MINKNVLVEKIPLIEPKWVELGSRIYQKVWEIGVKSDRLWGSVKAINKMGQEYDCSKLNILDIGCNCGVLSVVASEHFNSAIGIDINAKSIDGARETAKFFGKSNCRFEAKGVKKYLESGGFERDNITAIMAYQVLYLLSNEEVKGILNRMDKVKAVIFGSRPSKNRSKSKYGLWTDKSIRKYLVSPFFDSCEILYKHESRWPIVFANKGDKIA